MSGREKWTAEYAAYHARVVEACCALMGEKDRDFWDKTCSYEEEFANGDDPHDVAEEQRWSL